MLPRMWCAPWSGIVLAAGIALAADQVKPDVSDKPDPRSLADRGKQDPKTGAIDIKDIPYMDILEIKMESAVIEYHRGNGVIPGKDSFKLAKEVRIMLDGKATSVKDIMMMRSQGKRIMPTRLKLSKDKAITEIDAIEFRLPNQ